MVFNCPNKRNHSIMCYKGYQQVLNLSVKPKTIKASNAKKVLKESTHNNKATPVKRRTKTGCLTCRRRKKKCDEDKVDGKCQGCTRNFLECCWPEPVSSSLIPISTPPSPTVKTPSPKLNKGIDAYPSPSLSPVQEAKKEVDDIKFMALSPSNYKIAKSLSVKSENIVIPSPAKARFIITSIDADKALCHIKAN